MIYFESFDLLASYRDRSVLIVQLGLVFRCQLGLVFGCFSLGLGPNELCRFAVDTNPRNNYPPPGQNCEWWCRNPSGAGSCSAMDPATCRLR